MTDPSATHPPAIACASTHCYAGGVAVLTGAASGFGLEAARMAARHGMRIVMADVQEQALHTAAAELKTQGAQVISVLTDVSDQDSVAALAQATLRAYGVPNLVFNNAGVASGGLIWENTLTDWQWVLGVNLMGVVHGVRAFTPLMLEAAAKDPSWRGHLVNTASMAGLLSVPNSGIYNVSKHAVVTLTETLYHDLALVSDQVSCAVLCPFFVPTGISQSERNRPNNLANEQPTRSQLIGRAMGEKAVARGKVSAAQVIERVFQSLDDGTFYIYSHPQALQSVRTRMDDILTPRAPTDAFADRPDIGHSLRAALRGED
jgi:NAD(P)-dependent dehydrogenase (short-subunit alcohol dehydrogenase family)